MYKKRILFNSVTAGILVSLIAAIIMFTINSVFENKYTDNSIRKIDNVIATIDNVQTEVTLPYSFNSLDSRTPVTITATITPKTDETIYLKTVYAPLKVYSNDNLIYEYGEDGTFPNFLIDPPTAVSFAQIPQKDEAITLRMEFLSPISRDVLTVHPPIIGREAAILSELVSTMGFPFMFSILQIITGIIISIIAFFIMTFNKKGVAFLWLGLFAISSGAWAFGECNLTCICIYNPSLLFCFAFIGLFSMTIPLLNFTIEVVDFHNPSAIYTINIFMKIAVSIAIILQLTGVMSLARSMYFFHIAVPIVLCILSVFVFYEAIKYKNIAAQRFITPITILAVSSILEVINYQIRFTYLFASLFQLGIVIFIILTGAIGGIYIRDMMLIKEMQQQIQAEMKLIDLQVSEQKKYHNVLIEQQAKIREQRHDLRHHLATIRYYANQNNKNELTQYIDELVKNVPIENNFIMCQNIAVNAVIMHYVNLARANNIETTVKVDIPERFKYIADSDLCVIIGNLLENAIEACERMTEGKKFITVKSSIQHRMLIITMDNSFDGKYKKQHKLFISSKTNELGTGLSSVENVARSYSGEAFFNIEDNIFQSSVYIKIKERMDN